MVRPRQRDQFLQTDPIGSKDDLNLYGYVGGDPINKSDPTGLYGRGSGFDDKQWKKFDAAQQAAAGKMEKRAGELSKAAETGKMTGSMKREFGKNASSEQLAKAANDLKAGAAALRSDGSDGYMAKGVSQTEYRALGGSEFGAAFAPIGGKDVTVNLGNSVWSEPSSLAQRAIGHESLHSAGLGHVKGSNGLTGYAAGTEAQQEAYREIQGTSNALINPDNLMNYSIP